MTPPGQPDQPVLSVRGLTARAGTAVLLADVDLDLAAGQILAVVGASGAGKSTLGRAVLGHGDPGVDLGGSVRAHGTDLLPTTGTRISRPRVGYLPQHPGAVLDPIRRVGGVLDELAATVHGRDRTARHTATRQALARAGVPADTRLTRHYPHQLSGGQQQRLALAHTLITRPRLLVLDEPTTGQNHATTATLITSLAALAADGMALLLLTHDHTLARRLAHHAVLLHHGRITRRGPVADILGAPTATSTTIGTGHHDQPPRVHAADLNVVADAGQVLLDVATFAAAPAACVAITGPTGAGKTTLARCLAGLTVPHTGRVTVDGAALAPDARDRSRHDRRRVQYVHQDPRATFGARRTVLDQVARPAILLRGLPPRQARAEALALLDLLGVPTTPARRPHALSGGQLQRAALARALIAHPAVLVADEITSAQDPAHRTRILDALDRQRRQHALTVILISHDRDLIAATTTTTTVLHHGHVLDHGPTNQVLARAVDPDSAQTPAIDQDR